MQRQRDVLISVIRRSSLNTPKTCSAPSTNLRREGNELSWELHQIKSWCYNTVTIRFWNWHTVSFMFATRIMEMFFSPAERQRLDLLLELQEFPLVSGVVKQARSLTVEPIRKEVQRSERLISVSAKNEDYLRLMKVWEILSFLNQTMSTKINKNLCDAWSLQFQGFFGHRLQQDFFESKISLEIHHAKLALQSIRSVVHQIRCHNEDFALSWNEAMDGTRKKIEIDV